MEVCSLTMPLMTPGMIIGIVAALIVLFIAGFAVGVVYRKKVSEKEISSAEEEAKRIINEAIKSAENKKRESLLEAKEEIHRNRSEYEREVKERRAELQKQERRLQQKEENLDKKTDSLDKKADTLNEKIAAAEAQQEEVNRIKKSQLDMLEKISGYSVEDAKGYLIDSVRTDVTHEMAMLYSLAGGILSLLVMLLLARMPKVGVIGVSACGAISHNIGQIAMNARESRPAETRQMGKPSKHLG